MEKDIKVRNRNEGKMKRFLLINAIIAAFLLSGCTKSASGQSVNSTSSESTSLSSESHSNSESDSEEEEEEEGVISHISLNKRYLDLVKGKSYTSPGLTVSFTPSNIPDEYKDGVWASSDESIATVKYGSVTAKKEGTAVITYTTTLEKHVASCIVYVYESEASIVKEYQKVTDADSIEDGDIIIIGCPELGVAASLNRKSGYIVPSNATFSGNTITSFDDDVAEFYVGKSEGPSFTLETQENKYLGGKSNDYKNSLVYLDSDKGQINWIFEKPDGYSNIFCVNYDIQDDLWLMFNEINDNDIRLNLYDSNPTALMILPTIYRLTTVH